MSPISTGATRDLRAELRSHLARGPARARDALSALRINQTAFTRLVSASRTDILVTGRARATRYMARREVPAVGRTIPLYEIQEDGTSRQLATLHAVLPRAFHVEGLTADCASAYYGDLPYFMNELRPAGFLGRLAPRRHPDLQLPADIQHWTADHCLSFLTRHGWNMTGNLIAGEEAFRLYLGYAVSPPDVVERQIRGVRYPELADNVMSLGIPGSSAAGEQPKFLVSRTPGPTPVLVKFSPPINDATSERIGDLLVAEHLALECLRTRGRDAARTEIVEGGRRIFLEVERFDRIPGAGRRGLLSLYALDAEFVDHLKSWTDTASELRRQNRIDDETLGEVRRRHLFGRLIGNTDMHAGNLSFFTRGTTLGPLAPTYDMAPAMYAPVQGHVPTPNFDVAVPEPADAPFWRENHATAHDTWMAIASHPLVSKSFRAVAAANAAKLAGKAAEYARLLPKAE